MNTRSPASASPRRPLRVWPAAVLIALVILVPMGAGWIEDGPAWIWMASAFGPALCSILLLIWWLAASRATVRERLAGVGVLILGVVLAIFGMHPSMHGPAIIVIVFPAATSVFAIGVCVADRFLSAPRTSVGLGAAMVVLLLSLMARTGGMWGNFKQELTWRWNQSVEEKLLGSTTSGAEPPPSPVAVADSPPEWPGFRGTARDSRQSGLRFSSDWAVRPPQLLWKTPVGPGWSSFAYQGGLLFTQEQRGAEEMVVCYSADTGARVWTSAWEARLDDPLGGPGPRATPTLSAGRLFAQGATGILRCLDPKDGTTVWERDIGEIAKRPPPMWGFSSSPLVFGQVVIVHAGGAGDKGTLAFDIASGDLRWSAPGGNDTYSSPHPAKYGEEELVLMLSNLGLDFLSAATGSTRFSYAWKHSNYRALQPQLVSADSLLLPTGTGAGTRLIRLSRNGEAITAREVWTSRHLKPDFNDFVVYQDHAYGFDNNIFTCIRLETGERAWKGGRYGKGQVLLLADSELLFVMGERGEGILLRATPTEHEELAKVPLLNGKTWNHPAIVGDRLFVRNAEEAACYRLPLLKESP